MTLLRGNEGGHFMTVNCERHNWDFIDRDLNVSWVLFLL